ncbi:MAG: hypothetical protein MJY91_06350 [Bacteroidales bacterium]|nr:hypothetical protein [Candidatus Cryptobacteroides choladohippi]MCQ2179700.1 hypothetical protein [Bacteroidales bacterium]
MTHRISINEMTLHLCGVQSGVTIPFRVRIEMARLLSKLGVSVIETSPIRNGKSDYFLVKSLASAVTGSTISVPLDILDPDSPAVTWDALKEASHPRLSVPVPVSTVQMEYLCHKKPDGILDLIRKRVSECAALCGEVEFVALDFTRSDRDFLLESIHTAIEAGAGIVTVADVAGDLLEDEFQERIRMVRNAVPADVRLGVFCSNEMYIADTCAIAAVRAGADEVRVESTGNYTTSLKRFARILNMKAGTCGASCDVGLTAIDHICARIHEMCEGSLKKTRKPVAGYSDEEFRLSVHDSLEDVLAAVSRLGYNLGEQDGRKVYDAFVQLASDNESIGSKEFDAIIASVAFQVPPTYILESFLINTGNTITPTCHIRLKKGDETLESVCMGDGPVDAAFLAIDNIIGCHYELDNYQLRSVTEGREAMGETIVRLRQNGRLYSGRGVSKDIVASGVLAYLNAINKIVYGEGQE